MDDQTFIYIFSSSKNVVRRFPVGGNDIGTIVAGRNEEGDRLNQLDSLFHIFADQDHSICIPDCSNHHVMLWLRDSNEGIVVSGGRGKGSHKIQCSRSHGMIVDQLGTVYVADSANNRVVR
ncbi:unnamed protein product [Rotaria socialis]|nr:unnamed protein product [Rotaria socialis]CAF3811934.1 unnamed protein product [Rotaria socialis]